ncbi:MAG: ATP-binding cassette domain-containing protein [Clostridia bacterium]|nr:ATP-binding cassette domain-containing protein [Clostridia bacterium]
MIKLTSLNKYFNKGRANQIHVINNADLELPERGMVAIFGKSGCGKTTLLNVIGGLDSFESGTLTVEGQSVRANPDDIRNKYIGYIFQNYNLHKDESCYDNVADALRLCGMKDGEAMERRVMAALTNVGMDKYRSRTPDTLSGGQQQRIAIARAIVKNPRIILADEPTGNLDEANTVMIMDLLKQISRDHLVLLVTHEASLVDYYCDTVIELNDGKIVNIRNNESAGGFIARDKNDIFLGELSKESHSDNNTEIEYYGDHPQAPIKLRIINNGGKLYIKVDTPNVRVLDDYSEIKLREGVFVQAESRNALSDKIDMSELPPIQGTKFGRLFTFVSSLKSGFTSNFKSKKKRKNLLISCMAMFAAVLVFMSAMFGTAFATLINAEDSYNHSVFYVYTPNAAISQKLNNAVGKQGTGIDYVVLNNGSIPSGDKTIRFRTGSFETFSVSEYASGLESNCVFLSTALSESLKRVAGKSTGLAPEEILITTKVADNLLKTSTLGYISDYDDLIGLISNSITVDQKNIRVAGIVESNETAVYLSEVAIAKYNLRNNGLYVALDKDTGYEVEAGKTVYYHVYDEYFNNGEVVKTPKLGETVLIRGVPLEVTKIVKLYTDYAGWLQGNNINKLDEYSYYQSLLTDPDADPYSLQNEHFFEWCEYYSSEFDNFLKDYYEMEPSNMDLWMWSEKGVEIMAYRFLSFVDPNSFYKADCFRDANGRFPTLEELGEVFDNYPDFYEEIQRYYKIYEEEYYNRDNYYKDTIYGNKYVVDESDYVQFSKQLGETHQSAMSPYYYEYEKKSSEAVEVDYDYKYEYVYEYDTMSPWGYLYTVIHSADPGITEKWLLTEFADLEAPTEYSSAIISPTTIFDSIIEDGRDTMIGGFITMGCTLLLLSLCMYFIMRSSLMNRIKEIGIYRAIGVSKKNLIFRFLIESIVLTVFTVVIGYALSSTFIFACLNASPLIEEMMFYPIWLATADLFILLAICIICGILPILSLLRRTPSEILAKYDI